jgi:hypothetical protein
MVLPERRFLGGRQDERAIRLRSRQLVLERTDSVGTLLRGFACRHALEDVRVNQSFSPRICSAMIMRWTSEVPW